MPHDKNHSAHAGRVRRGAMIGAGVGAVGGTAALVGLGAALSSRANGPVAKLIGAGSMLAAAPASRAVYHGLGAVSRIPGVDSLMHANKGLVGLGAFGLYTGLNAAYGGGIGAGIAHLTSKHHKKHAQETSMTSLSEQMKLAASASTLEGAIVRGANRVKRMRAGGPRSALGAIESHGQRAGLRAGGVLQDLSDLYTPGGVGRRIDRADPDAMAAMWNMKTSQETSMTLSEQMKLAKHEPFGGKQAKPFGKKDEKPKGEEKKAGAANAFEQGMLQGAERFGRMADTGRQMAALKSPRTSLVGAGAGDMLERLARAPNEKAVGDLVDARPWGVENMFGVAKKKKTAIKKTASLSEQMKAASFAGGAAGGLIGGAILESFLRRNPHLLDILGKGTTRKILPRGIAPLTAALGGGAEYMATRDRNREV